MEQKEEEEGLHDWSEKAASRIRFINDEPEGDEGEGTDGEPLLVDFMWQKLRKTYSRRVKFLWKQQTEMVILFGYSAIILL